MVSQGVSQLSQTKTWYGEIPTHYIYTMGIAGERFFKELRDNARIMGARCEKCNLIYVPPRLYCERCFEKLEQWVDMGSKGEVHTFTIAHVGLDGSTLSEPVILAMVAIEGAHGGLVHRLGEVKPEQVKVGMKVEAVFEDKTKRTGSILDIKYFKPRTEC